MKILRIVLKTIGILIGLVIVFIVGVFVIDGFNDNYLNVPKAEQADKTLVITNVNIVPMTKDTILENKSVLIKDGKISKIMDSFEGEDIEIVDGQNKYLVPGLMDMHVHVWDTYELGLYLSNGITTVRNLWGQPIHLRLKNEIAEKHIYSPLFYTSGPKFTGPEFIGDDNTQLFSTEEATQAVITAKEKGYDFLKTYYGLPEDYFDAILKQAEVSNMDIVAHPSNKVDFSYHFNPQIVSVEHAEDIVQQALNYSLDTLKLNEVVNKFGKAHGTSFCPTITVYHNIYNMLTDESILESEAMDLMNPLIRKVDSKAQFDRWQYAKVQDSAVVERILEQHKFHLIALKKLHDAGVNIICGTDAGIGVTVPGKSLHDELDFYKEAGLSNFEVLKTATVNPSKVHDFMADLGTVEAEKTANLILVDKNPLQDLSTLRSPQMVFINGNELNRETLDAFEDKASDRSNLLASGFRYAEFLLSK